MGDTTEYKSAEVRIAEKLAELKKKTVHERLTLDEEAFWEKKITGHVQKQSTYRRRWLDDSIDYNANYKTPEEKVKEKLAELKKKTVHERLALLEKTFWGDDAKPKKDENYFYGNRRRGPWLDDGHHKVDPNYKTPEEKLAEKLADLKTKSNKKRLDLFENAFWTKNVA